MSSKATALRSLAGRYADALFSLASEKGQLSDIEKDARQLVAMLEASTDLRRAAMLPTLPHRELNSAFATLSKKAGFCPLMQNFLGVLAVNRRLSVLAESMRVLLDRIASAQEGMKAQVVSAIPLSNGQEKNLERLLKDKVGRPVSVHSHVDSSILGGVVVYMGSKMFDNSVRTKLQRLRVSMKGVG